MKTMKKSIVLKMLAGVITTVFTVTGIAVSMTIGSDQNTADASVIAEEDIRAAETAVDMEITNDESNAKEADAAEEILAKSEYTAIDEQGTDVAVAGVQGDDAAVVAYAGQKSDAGTDAGTVENTVVGTVKGTGTLTGEPKSDIEPKSGAGTDAGTVENTVVGTVGTGTPTGEPNPDAGQTSDIVQGSDKEVDAQTDNKSGNMAYDYAECTVTGIVEGTGSRGIDTGKETGEVEKPVDSVASAEPEEPAEEGQADENCVVGHRYCVCGAVFDIRKISRLDEAAWRAHVKEHVAKGEMVRYTDK